MDSLILLDPVALLVDVPSENLRKGSLGTVVEILGEDNYLVEFTNTDGVPYSMPVLGSGQLMKVYQEPVTA